MTITNLNIYNKKTISQTSRSLTVVHNDDNDDDDGDDDGELFYEMVDRWKTLNFISSHDDCQSFPPSQSFEMPCAGS